MAGRARGTVEGCEQLEALVAQAAAGDRAAQNDLLQRYWPIIASVVGARLGEAARSVGVEDITQEAALRLLQKLKTYRGTDGRAFAAWVRAIAESALIDHVRRANAAKRGRRITQPLDDQVEAPRIRTIESQVVLLRRLEHLHAELHDLKESVRGPLMLHELGYSYQEISDIIGCTPEAARKRVSRGTAELEAALKAREGR